MTQIVDGVYSKYAFAADNRPAFVCRIKVVMKMQNCMIDFCNVP